MKIKLHPVMVAAQPTRVSRKEFMLRLTAAERRGIRALAKTDPKVEDALDLIMLDDEIDMAGPLVTEFLVHLAAQGEITEQRKEELPTKSAAEIAAGEALSAGK